MSGSTSRTIAGVHRHAEHTLIRAKKLEMMLHTCKDCKDQIIGLGSCYKCNDCKGYVHKACLEAKPNSFKLHPFIPDFWLKLTLAKRGTTMIHCSACCGYINGIMYTGSHGTKKYNLHPQCINLAPTLRPGNSTTSSRLELKLCSTIQTKCVVCETKDKEGWCYSMITNGKYKFGCHLRCIKDKVAKEWLRKRIPVEYSSREAYFLSLYRRDLVAFKAKVGDVGLAVASLGLDLTISAFVGAPLATLLSVALSLSVEAAKEKLEAVEKRLRIGRN